jgi:TIR domain
MQVKISFCYAHEDEAHLNKLKTHLKPLQRESLIDIWHDRDTSAGAEWEQVIKEQLNKAQIILLLVSPNFMESDYCYSNEMKQALERHERREVRVIPIILRPTRWRKSPFAKLQALPKDAKPVTNWSDPDEVYRNSIDGIHSVIEELVSGEKDILECGEPLSLDECSFNISRIPIASNKGVHHILTAKLTANPAKKCCH